MKKILFKELNKPNDNGETWCEVSVELREVDGGDRFSICGTAGYILTEEEAYESQIESYVSWLEECPNERLDLMDREEKYYSIEQAAKEFASDGEIPELHTEEDGKYYIVSSCGQITDTIKEFFPELKQYLNYHLNDMKAECPHQLMLKQTFTTHPLKQCEECGWILGKDWCNHPLPPHVKTWIHSLE